MRIKTTKIIGKNDVILRSYNTSYDVIEEATILKQVLATYINHTRVYLLDRNQPVL